MNKIDILCNRVNEKYNLRRHQVAYLKGVNDVSSRF